MKIPISSIRSRKDTHTHSLYLYDDCGFVKFQYPFFDCTLAILVPRYDYGMGDTEGRYDIITDTQLTHSLTHSFIKQSLTSKSPHHTQSSATSDTETTYPQGLNQAVVNY